MKNLRCLEMLTFSFSKYTQITLSRELSSQPVNTLKIVVSFFSK